MVSRETLLNQFADALYEANELTNLVSRRLSRSDVGVLVRSSANTLEAVGVEAPEGLLDIGSGGGLPGIPLAIRNPETRVVLVESRRLRVQWLRRVTSELGIENARVLAGRVERYQDLEETFPAVTAFGVGPPDEVIPLAARYLSPGGAGLISAPRAPSPEDESRWLLTAALNDCSVEHLAGSPGSGRALLVIRSRR